MVSCNTFHPNSYRNALFRVASGESSAVILPICESKHWMLLIVCNYGIAFFVDPYGRSSAPSEDVKSWIQQNFRKNKVSVHRGPNN